MDDIQSNSNEFIYIQQKVPVHTQQLDLLATMGSRWGQALWFHIYRESSVRCTAQEGVHGAGDGTSTPHATLLSCELGAMTHHRKVNASVCKADLYQNTTQKCSSTMKVGWGANLNSGWPSYTPVFVAFKHHSSCCKMRVILTSWGSSQDSRRPWKWYYSFTVSLLNGFLLLLFIEPSKFYVLETQSLHSYLIVFGGGWEFWGCN